MSSCDVSDELMQAFVASLQREEPANLYADRAFATPSEAYSSFIELVKRTFPAEKLELFKATKGKDTLEEALSVDVVFSMAFEELRETFNLPK